MVINLKVGLTNRKVGVWNSKILVLDPNGGVQNLKQEVKQESRKRGELRNYKNTIHANTNKF